MNQTAILIYGRIRLFSRLAVLVAIALSAIFRGFIADNNLTWQLTVAFIALALGIPHGAIDHLISIPKGNPARFATFVVIYTLIALLALAGILHWNRWGFEVVVWMSAFHFGIGDLTYITESDHLAGKKEIPSILRPLYLLAAGLTPVLLPLLHPKSNSALKDINPKLIDWAASFSHSLKMTVIAIAVIAVVIFLAMKRIAEGIDLLLLLALALLTPPLIAFAVYFGCWHATRHTARLTLLLDSSRSALQEGNPKQAVMRAIIPGLPSLVGAVVLGLILSLTTTGGLSKTALWSLLAIVWALTVPHMLATFRFDIRSLKEKSIAP